MPYEAGTAVGQGVLMRTEPRPPERGLEERGGIGRNQFSGNRPVFGVSAGDTHASFRL